MAVFPIRSIYRFMILMALKRLAGSEAVCEAEAELGTTFTHKVHECKHCLEASIRCAGRILSEIRDAKGSTEETLVESFFASRLIRNSIPFEDPISDYMSQLLGMYKRVSTFLGSNEDPNDEEIVDELNDILSYFSSTDESVVTEFYNDYLPKTQGSQQTRMVTSWNKLMRRRNRTVYRPGFGWSSDHLIQYHEFFAFVLVVLEAAPRALRMVVDACKTGNRTEVDNIIFDPDFKAFHTGYPGHSASVMKRLDPNHNDASHKFQRFISLVFDKGLIGLLDESKSGFVDKSVGPVFDRLVGPSCGDGLPPLVEDMAN